MLVVTLFGAIGLIVGLIISVVMATQSRFGLVFFLFSALILCPSFGFLGATVGKVAALGVGSFFPQRYFEIERKNLESLRSAGGTAGSFYLGSGTLGFNEYYFFYVKAEGGGYRLEKVKAKKATIHEGYKNPFLRILVKKFENPTVELVGIASGGRRFGFHIPSGRLKREFVLR